MRSQGMGSGQIAPKQGTKLGPGIRGLKSANQQMSFASRRTAVAKTIRSTCIFLRPNPTRRDRCAVQFNLRLILASLLN